MAMMSRFVDFFRNKIETYLPSEGPETEAERLYEEGKQKVYRLHQDEADLFYVDNIWMEDEKLHIYGEFARGDFEAGQDVESLDNYAGHLFFGKVENVMEERPQSVKVKRGFLKTTPKVYLILTCENLASCEDSFVYTNYLVKRHDRLK